ncbi:MAG: DUF1631 domain-containing protein [Gammaproteobacteria bacterium]|nr:DUF1631 domain-containing protein [Gammaproteobacteria bacterium]MCW8923439.1 DUF1631 domain-containing protein [Gammaproteobacteria bacterium]
MTRETYTLKTGDLAQDQPQEHQYSTVIENIYSFLNDELLQLFNEMLNRSEQSLIDLEKSIELSISANSNYQVDEKQEQEINALKLLRSERASIHTNFFISINEQLLPSTISAFEESDEEELSLVDTDEMEEMVAITTMHANALNLFGEEVSHFEARIEFLEIMSAPIFAHKAASPNRICEAFQIAIKPFDLSSEKKMVLFKYFDEHVNLNLANMYQTINTMLIDAGVLPEVILSSKNDDEPTEQKEFESRTATYYDPEENKATDFIPRSQSEMNSIVSQFMKGDISVTGDELELPESFYKDPNEQNASDRKLFARKDVLKSLNKLQNKLLELGAHSELGSNEGIKQALMKEMGINPDDPIAREMAVLDERSIDFVGMMFDAITSDESISPVISDLVMQLQIPIIKVAVSDEELFSNEDHSARNVLNLIPKAGKSVTDKQDYIYNDLEEIVNDILNEYEIDIVCFDKAVESLETLISREENLAKTKEREQQRAIIRDHARNVVISELRNLTANRVIPDDAQPLVLKNWSTLMLNRHIKHGKESYEWMESILLLKLMLKCLQPIKKKSQWEFVNNNHAALLETVNDELYGTRQDKKDIDEKLTLLKNTFISMLDQSGYVIEEAVQDDEQSNTYESIDSDMEQELDSARQEAQIALEKINRLPENVKPGVWFEVFNGEGKAPRRLKMSAVLTEAAKIIFVNVKGIKVIEKDAADFAEELDQNKSKVLDDHSTFDRALGKVIGSMAA